MIDALPFKIGEIYAGFGECHGLLRDEGEHLTIEFQVQDSVAGVLKSKIRHVQIPLDEIVSLTLTKGWLGTSWLGVKVAIQTSRLETLKDVPGASQGRIELSIARKDVEAAEMFVAHFYDDRDA
jgi:hypothetical protein